VIVIALFCGFLIGKIPPLTRRARAKWDMFRPRPVKKR
jgi:hypothetical protein